MFRGGRVDSRGTGITSGLGYAKGGSVNTPKRGLVDGPGGYAGEYRFGETGFGKVLGGIGAVRPAFYDLFNTLANKGTQFFTGYNPGLSYNKMLRSERDLKDQMMGKDPLKRTDRMTDDEVDYTNFLFMKPSAKKGWAIPSMEKGPVTGVDLPPGGGRTRLGTGEDYAEIPEEPKEKSTEELLKELMGKKKTAKEKVSEFKEVFEDAYGSGVADDASRMLMSFAGKALKPGADTKSAFGEFFEEESKVEGKRSKYKDAATTAAINAFLTGEKDYQTLMNQMTLIDHQLKKKEDYAAAKKTIDNLLSAYASSAKDDRTDPGVMQAAYNDLYQTQIFEGPLPENKDELIVGKIYYQDHPTDSRNKIIFLVKADGSLKQINTILK
tara:strand:- start:123 stop:1268 length:1146 start_codon:yes stop_codon:yes gene_type:complete